MSSYKNIYKRICRVCMRPCKNKMVSLLDARNKDGLSDYGKSIQYFAKVKIKPNSELPSNMCYKCVQLLKNAIKLKLTSERTDKHMQNLLRNTKTSPTFEETFVQCVLYLNNFNKTTAYNINNTYETKSCKITDKVYEVTIENYDNDYNCNEEGNSTYLDDGDFKTDVCIENTDSKSREGNIDELFDLMEKAVGSGQVMEVDTKESIYFDEQFAESELQGKQLFRKRKSGFPLTKTTCDICRKVLSTPGALRAHMDRHGIYKFMCEICGKAYPSKKELILHQSTRHDIGNTFSCEYCSFKTSRKIDLIEHIRLHTGERPFACDKCGLTFRRKFIYKKHLVHHSEKKVQCPHCPARFFHKSHMHSHCNSVHERRYVYSCIRCTSMYAKAASLRKHYLTKHEIPREEQVLNKVYQIPRPPVRNLNRRLIES